MLKNALDLRIAPHFFTTIDPSQRSLGRKTFLLILAAIILLSIVPRFYELDRLGFYSDEEISSTASFYYFKDGYPHQESGMPYFRAFSHTLGNQLFLSNDTLTEEHQYRLFSALTGVGFILLFALLVRPLAGDWPTLIATLLLCLSDWHITLSREARMYGPFILFFTISLLCMWNYISTKKPIYTITGIILAAIAINLHIMGALLSAILLAPFLTSRRLEAPVKWLSLSSLIVIFALINQKLTKQDTKTWFASVDHSTDLSLAERMSIFSVPDYLANIPLMAVIAIVLLTLASTPLLYQLSKQQCDHALGRLAWVMVSIASIGVMCIGQVYAAALLLLSLLAMSKAPVKLWAEKKTVLFLCAGIFLAGVLLNLYLNQSINFLFKLPFPYLIFFAKKYSILAGLFVWGCVVALFFKGAKDWNKAFILGATVPFICIGMVVKNYHDIRYIVPAYPFILLVASVGFIDLSHRLASALLHPRLHTLALCALLILVGFVSGHGIQSAHYAATLDYGSKIPGKLWPYPDHKTTGQFVKSQLMPEDIVIAEDALQQMWYVGRVDYWLRSRGTTRTAYYVDERGQSRNIYTNALALTQGAIDQIQYANGRTWVITSAETRDYWSYNLSDYQLKWLNELRASSAPVYVGEDKLTEVYVIEPRSDRIAHD